MAATGNAEYLEARMKLLAKEKELTKMSDEVAEMRRALPKVVVKDPDQYDFMTAEGPRKLHHLFGKCSQLIVQHFMFGEEAAQGCPSCSFWADGFTGLPAHLRARDAAFVVVAQAPIEKLSSFRERMGWFDLKFASSHGSSFNKDFGVYLEKGPGEGKVYYNFGMREMNFSKHAPGLSIFQKEPNGDILHTYSCYGRGLDHLNSAYHLLDLCPKGRDEKSLKFSMEWVRHHDKYEKDTMPHFYVVPEINSPDANGHIEWIKNSLGGQTDEVWHKDAEKKVMMHGPVVVHGGDVYVASAHWWKDAPGSEADKDKACIHLNCANADEIWKKALEGGAKSTCDLHDSFWGMRYGRFRDPFGQEWAVGSRLKRPPPAADDEASKKAKH